MRSEIKLPILLYDDKGKIINVIVLRGTVYDSVEEFKRKWSPNTLEDYLHRNPDKCVVVKYDKGFTCYWNDGFGPFVTLIEYEKLDENYRELLKNCVENNSEGIKKSIEKYEKNNEFLASILRRELLGPSYILYL